MEVFESPVRYAGTLSFNELAYWVAFSRVIGIGPVRFRLLLDFFHCSQLERFSTKPAPRACFPCIQAPSFP